MLKSKEPPKWSLSRKETILKKVNNSTDNKLINPIDQFRKLFSVLDAQRVGKSGMTEMLTQERLGEWIAKLAVYKIDLQWRLIKRWIQPPSRSLRADLW
jgi:hypothetical protein